MIVPDEVYGPDWSHMVFAGAQTKAVSRTVTTTRARTGLQPLESQHSQQSTQ